MGMIRHTTIGFARPKRKRSRPALPPDSRLVRVVDDLLTRLRSGEKILFLGRRYHKDVSRYGVLSQFGSDIYSARIAKSGFVLQVLLSSGWSSVFSTDKLLSSDGTVIYESPDCEEVERMLSGDYADEILSDFFLEFGVLPFEKRKVA